MRCECPEGMELLADKKNCVHRNADSRGHPEGAIPGYPGHL